MFANPAESKYICCILSQIVVSCSLLFSYVRMGFVWVFGGAYGFCMGAVWAFPLSSKQDFSERHPQGTTPPADRGARIATPRLSPTGVAPS